MTDYTEQDIDQMIDEILEQPETVTKVCRKCGASFEAKRGSTRTLCPACFREARAANGSGSWAYTSFFVLWPDGREKECHRLQDAKRIAEGVEG